MFEDAVSSSIWASMNSWFTPAVLFVLLNVMIGTIAFTSTLANQKHHHQNPNPNHRLNDHLHHPPAPAQPNIVRSSSVLQRLMSMNFYSYRSQEPLVSSHFKLISPDSSPSDPQYHQVQLHYQTTAPPPEEESSGFESRHSQYIFAQAAEAVHREEKQPVAGGFYESAEGIAGNNGVDNTNNYYRHEEIYQGKPSLEQTQSPQYFFQQTNEEGKHQEDHFQQVTEQENTEMIQEKSTHFDFDQSKEGKIDFNEYQHYDLSEKTHEENDDELQSMDEVYSKLSSERHVSRSNSDTKPSAGEIPSKLSKKMKSASMKSSFNHFDEEDIVEARRPATVKETPSSTRRSVAEADEEVDAKADDFINRFKQQLKLQRLDSIIRYKEMIGRGSGR